MASAEVVDGHGTGPLDAVVQQLWASGVDAGHARVVVGGSGSTPRAGAEPAAGWRTVEDYWAVPDLARARLLVPAGGRRVAAAALTAYPGLRPGRTRVVRGLLGTAVRLGAPAGRGRVRLQVRTGSEAPGSEGPVAAVARAHGLGEVRAVIGVRLGANAKPTLQLFDPTGRVVGFAKVAWEEQSARFVRVEDRVLTELGEPGRLTGSVRVPRVLGRGELDGWPYVLTEPLPPEARRPRADEGPSTAELLALAPVVRRDLPRGSAHLRGLAERLRAHPPGAAEADLTGAARRLLDRLLAHDRPVALARHWHGDLVPWNTARDATGRLWVWDWETAEDDVVAGLDAVHWTMNAPRPAPAEVPAAFTARQARSRAVLAAMGLDEDEQDVALAVYALALAERGLDLARTRGSWDRVLVGHRALLVLVDAAYRVICPVG